MRADFSTTRLHTTDKLPALFRAALALAAFALALFMMAGCESSADNTFHRCDNCGNPYNGGHVNQASCGHWFCDQKDGCKDALEEHEALAEGTPALECGADKHYRCDGADHSQAACGLEGHFGCDGAGHGAAEECGVEGHFECDGLAHAQADCFVDGHFACDGADHSQAACTAPAAAAAPSSSSVKPSSNSHSHYGGEATCLKQAACTGCGKSYGSVSPSNHDASCAYEQACPCSHECGSDCVTWHEVPESCNHDCAEDCEWPENHVDTSSCLHSCWGPANCCGDECQNTNGCGIEGCVWPGSADYCSCVTFSCTHSHDSTCNYSPGYSYSASSCIHAAHDETCGYSAGVPCSAA